MTERDVLILAHIGLYRVTLRPVLERLFFDGSSCGKIVQRLRDEGLIHAGAKLLSGQSYYQLTRAGASFLELSEARAKSFGTQALHEHLAVLWFCCMGKERRMRLEDHHLNALFPDAPPNGTHCLEAGGKRLYHLYAPTPFTAPANRRRQMQAHLDENRKIPVIRTWIEKRKYGFAVLVGSEAAAKELRRELSGHDKAPSLSSLAHFHVDYVPLFQGGEVGRRKRGPE